MLSSGPALFCYHCSRYEFIRKVHDLKVWVTLWRGRHWPTRWSWSAPRTEIRESIDLSRVHYTQEISPSCSQPMSPSGNTVSLDSKCLTEDDLTSVAKEVPYCQSGKKDNANCIKSMLAGSASKDNPPDISLATIVTWNLSLSSCGHITYWRLKAEADYDKILCSLPAPLSPARSSSCWVEVSLQCCEVVIVLLYWGTGRHLVGKLCWSQHCNSTKEGW